MALVLDGNGTMTVGNGDITGLVAGALPSTVIGAGAVLQVIANTTSSSTATGTSTYVDTNSIATITPTSSTSKILVIVYCGQVAKSANDTQLNLRLVRGATEIFIAVAINQGLNAQLTGNPTIVYYDSPSTTSATTYKVQARTNCPATFQWDTGKSNIILMEIGA
jgi:hypothetical protein